MYCNKETHKKTFLLIFSAVLYALPLWCSTLCWPLVFVFPMPLLYLGIYFDLTWRHGALWGLVALSCHLAPVFWGIDTLAQGSLAIRLVPFVAMVLYLTSYSTLWFGMIKKIIQYCNLQSVAQRLVLWSVTYVLYILFMEHVCLWPFDKLEGYFLFNPGFVLAEQPRLLTLLPFVGSPLLTMLLMFFSASLLYWHLVQTRCAAFLFAIAATPWLLSLALPQPHSGSPTWLKRIATAPVSIGSRINISEQANIAKTLFKKIARDSPEVQLVIMPETAFDCDHLSDTPLLFQQWSAQELGRSLHIVVGTFRWEGSNYRNSLHWFYDGGLQKTFDKRHAMIFTEKIPSLFKFKLFYDLFFKDYATITPSTNPRPLFNMFDKITLIPYICSELFFNTTPDDHYAIGSTILMCSNDRWCRATNIPHLMHLAARFRAVHWQRNILYVSFAHSSYITEYGRVKPIKNIYLREKSFGNSR